MAVKLEAPTPIQVAGGTLLATAYVCGGQLAEPLPPIEYLVRSLGMPSGAGAPHLWGGFGFSGKTLFCQMMALSLAAGRAVWGSLRGTDEPIRVTHVDNEQGIALTTRRYQRGANATAIQLEEVGDRLRVLAFPRLRNGEAIKLVKEHRAAWLEVMSDREFLIVDSLDATRGGQSKSVEAEVRSALDLLGDLSEETRCRASVIHHANKASLDPMVARDPRLALSGSQAIFAASDAVYLLSTAEGEATHLRQIKARSHGENVEPMALSIVDVAQGDNPRWGLAIRVAGTELIEEQREAAKSEREAKRVGVHTSRIRDILRTRSLNTTELKVAAKLNGTELAAALFRLKDEVQCEPVKNGRATALVYRLVRKVTSGEDR